MTEKLSTDTVLSNTDWKLLHIETWYTPRRGRVQMYRERQQDNYSR